MLPLSDHGIRNDASAWPDQIPGKAARLRR